MTCQDEEIAGLNNILAGLDPVGRICEMQNMYPGRIFSTTSGGMTSLLLPYLAYCAVPQLRFPTIFLDHGDYPKETYTFVARMKHGELGSRLRINPGVDVRVYTSSVTLKMYEAMHGSLWEDEQDYSSHLAAAKDEPMNRAMADLQKEMGPALVWMRGGLSDKTLERSKLDIVRKEGNLLKFDPCIDRTMKWAYSLMRENGIPLNEFHSDRTKKTEKSECSLHNYTI